MSKQNLIILTVALVAGVGAMVLSTLYIRQARAEVNPTGEIVRIAVAKSDLPPNHTLNPSTDLVPQGVDRDAFPSIASASVRWSDREALRGERLSSAVMMSSPLMYSHLTQKATLALPEGSRAMAIRVDSTSRMGGMLVPGNRVDIVVNRKIPRAGTPMPEPERAPGTSTADAMLGQLIKNMNPVAMAGRFETAAEVVLENVRVIAVGDRLEQSREHMLSGMGAGAASSGNVITIEVTRDDGLKLIEAVASGGGKVTLMLCPDEIVSS